MPKSTKKLSVDYAYFDDKLLESISAIKEGDGSGFGVFDRQEGRPQAPFLG
jgi:hypothetical protein